ncbi:MAG: flavodoxin [Bacteroidales bacterium]|nr:flavodoxin [Bacteroidales bacterium]
MNKTLLIFWPEGGNVEQATQLIAKAYNEIDIMPVTKVTGETLANYDRFIVGGSTLGAETWEGTHSDSPWNAFLSTVKNHDFSSKKVALFGLGDQVLWPANFVDGLGTLYSSFLAAKAQLIGKWPTEGYDFTDSLAVEGDHFVGLALDLDQQDELTEERIQAWVKQIKKEF